MRLIARHYDQSGSQPVDSQPGEGRSLKPGTPEPDGDSNQERAKDRGERRKVQNLHAVVAMTLAPPDTDSVCKRVTSLIFQVRKEKE